MVDRPSAQVPDLHGAPKRRRELPYRVVGFLRFAREDRHHVLASRRPRRKVVNRIRRAAERTALRELPSLPVVHPPLVLVTFGTRHSSPLHRSQVRPGVHQRRPFSRAQNQAPSPFLAASHPRLRRQTPRAKRPRMRRLSACRRAGSVASRKATEQAAQPLGRIEFLARLFWRCPQECPQVLGTIAFSPTGLEPPTTDQEWNSTLCH